MKKHIIATLVAAATLSSAQAESLLEVYQLAKANDPTLRAAQAQYRAQEEQVTVTRGNLFPSISFQGNLGYSNTDTGSNSYDVTNNSLGVQMNYPIYSAALDYGVKAVELGLDAQKVQLDNAQETLTLATLEEYFDVLIKQAALENVTAQVKSTQSQLDRVKNQYDVGMVSITDLQDAQAAYDAIRVSELSARADLRYAQETLNQRVGKAITSIPKLADNYPISTENLASTDELIQKALRNNKDLLGANYQVTIANNNVDISKASGRTPTVTLTGGITRAETMDSNNPQSPEGDALQTSIGVNVTIPLYSGGAIDANVRQATATANAAEEQYAAAVQQIELGIRNLVAQLNTTAAQVTAQKQLIKSRESALEATQAGYDVGTRNLVELLTAQSNLFDAKTTYEQLRYRFVVTKLNLMELTGELNDAAVADLNKWL
ncbi:TolC family outer membrane protein [Maribrevibacterium harenarium]|uniref:TolC family outer membrane protein n=1 Tax=Maribrevibacterium harenarium TaxID=2589817 RepID=A0A501WGV0_9GAMM|nr:TolC family outer membrane protein [Maribrevibacterium harenarium]TPE47590.1 TolC family outer membrane protein [Maribrevibacterium harenarium]